MVFEQEYTVKVSVTGKSTMQLENIETILASLADVQNNHSKNVKMSITTRGGVEIKGENDIYSFDRYINGKNVGSSKHSMDLDKVPG